MEQILYSSTNTSRAPPIMNQANNLNTQSLFQNQNMPQQQRQREQQIPALNQFHPEVYNTQTQGFVRIPAQNQSMFGNGNINLQIHARRENNIFDNPQVMVEQSVTVSERIRNFELSRHVNIQAEGAGVLVFGVAALGYYAAKYSLWGIARGIEEIAAVINRPQNDSSSNRQVVVSPITQMAQIETSERYLIESTINEGHQNICHYEEEKKDSNYRIIPTDPQMLDHCCQYSGQSINKQTNINDESQKSMVQNVTSQVEVDNLESSTLNNGAILKQTEDAINKGRGSSRFIQGLLKRFGGKDCLCRPKCDCVNCLCPNGEDTPINNPDEFSDKYQNGDGNAYRHKKTGNVYAEDTQHCNHYDVYKNKKAFEIKKEKLRSVLVNGIIMNGGRCCSRNQQNQNNSNAQNGTRGQVQKNSMHMQLNPGMCHPIIVKPIQQQTVQYAVLGSGNNNNSPNENLNDLESNDDSDEYTVERDTLKVCDQAKHFK